jgi:hypothetical protein
MRGVSQGACRAARSGGAAVGCILGVTGLYPGGYTAYRVFVEPGRRRSAGSGGLPNNVDAVFRNP